MARRLPPLNALKAFEAAARLSSFSRAAAELNVTHAAISRHIRTLESEFRTPLFERTGRGVTLTEAGQSLAQELTKGFDLIAAASSRFARPSRRRKRLVVTSDVSFAALWLVPRLGKFTELHPEIDIVLDPSHRLVDFAKEDFDLGVRFGGGEWTGVDARKLLDAKLMLVSSPKFLADSPLAAPADLDGALLIQETAKECWNAWLAAAGISGRVVPSGPTLNGDLALAAAEAGQGFALADQIQAGDALLAKRLVRPFDIVVSRQGYYLVSRAGAKVPEAAAVFETWLASELQSFADKLTAQFAAAVFGTKRVRKPPMT
ncbi:transcriptional regulator GcvA [Hyphomicrobium sp. 99]|uniref:transcriptional regulator GcvA n=1 Tax=Hyphomicrobium sp. 99 TaxID=1163419 RepID=UPI0005F77802|nr:transcriptional regulator GcvA [Hyphomicrobium sp. 99]